MDGHVGVHVAPPASQLTDHSIPDTSIGGPDNQHAKDAAHQQRSSPLPEPLRPRLSMDAASDDSRTLHRISEDGAFQFAGISGVPGSTASPTALLHGLQTAPVIHLPDAGGVDAGHMDVQQAQVGDHDAKGAMIATSPEAALQPTADEEASIHAEKVLLANRNSGDNMDSADPEAALQSKDEGKPDDQSPQYLRGMPLWLLFMSMVLTVFLTSLDGTIVATALPRIVSQFDSLNDATWVAVAYMLTRSALMLVIGQLVNVVPLKALYLTCVIFFEAGSAICGAAPDINSLIVGRAIAGIGSAGITVCYIASIVNFTDLTLRPILIAGLSVVLAVSTICGPVLGGAFTDHLSWRWCFYINLPFGGIAVATMIFFMPNRSATHGSDQPLLRRLRVGIDWLGCVLTVSLTVCLLLAMQWGGVTYPWDSATVIALFVVFAVLLMLLCAWQWHFGTRSLIPPMMLSRRTQIFASLETFFLQAALTIAVYYIPEWYQIKGSSAIGAGLEVISFMLAYLLASIASSTIVSRVGYYWPFLVFAPLVGVPGSVLLYRATTNTSKSALIGYQILMGVGVGGAFTSTSVAVQADWQDITRRSTLATTISTFMGFIGGIIGLSLAGTVFDNGLGTQLDKVPGLSAELRDAVLQSIEVIPDIPEPLRAEVIAAALQAVKPTWLFVLGCMILATLCGLFVKNHNVKERAKLVPRNS